MSINTETTSIGSNGSGGSGGSDSVIDIAKLFDESGEDGESEAEGIAYGTYSLNNARCLAMPRTSQVDMNSYQQKKTIAQGMMDLALISANVNQLRYILEFGDRHPYYYPSLCFIGGSLFVQVAVGIGLIVNSRYNVHDLDEESTADKSNNFTTIGIFLVTILNVFLSSFGVPSI